MQPDYSDSKKAQAKKPSAENVSPKNKAPEKSKKNHSSNGKLKAGIITLVVGVAALVAGVTLLLLNVLSKPAVRDADYLVEIGAWEREDAPGVIWNFTEIGKGKLTTNNHINDYDFIWAIDGGKLKIETNWLYTLNNDYSYILKQGDEAKLTLSTGEGEELVNINFHPASSVDTEVTEDN